MHKFAFQFLHKLIFSLPCLTHPLQQLLLFRFLDFPQLLLFQHLSPIPFLAKLPVLLVIWSIECLHLVDHACQPFEKQLIQVVLFNPAPQILRRDTGFTRFEKPPHFVSALDIYGFRPCYYPFVHKVFNLGQRWIPGCLRLGDQVC